MVYLFGDIHLRSNSEEDGNVIEWEENAKRFLKFLETIPFTKDDVVIQEGDLYHKALARVSVHKYANQLCRFFSDRVSCFFVIHGNHEISSTSGSNLDAIDTFLNVTILRDFRILTDHFNTYLICPYVPGVQFGGAYEKLLTEFLQKEGVAEVDFVLGHGALRHSKVMNMPFLDFTKVPLKFKKAIFGDIHAPSEEGNEISIGSTWSGNKGELYKFRYITINDAGVLTSVPFPEDMSCRFRFLTYEQGKGFNQDPSTLPSHDFKVVKVICRREEKFLLEKEIRAKISKNLYELSFDFIEEVKTQKIEAASEEALEKSFFEENKYSEPVVALFHKYR